MPQKKAEALKSEAKKLEDAAHKKLHAIEKAEKMLDDKTKKEIVHINVEFEKFKNKSNELSGQSEDTGWVEQAVRMSEMMKLIIEEESRQQVFSLCIRFKLLHSLFVKADEAATELEMYARPIRKELPMVSDFSEEDRIQIVHGIDKCLHKLKQKREEIESLEAKLTRKMQVLMDNTPKPSERKNSVLTKLQLSYEVVSGLNDPDRARDELLRRLSKELSSSDGVAPGSSSKKVSKTPGLHNKNEGHLSADGHSPKITNHQNEVQHPSSDEQHPEKPKNVPSHKK